MAFKLDKAFADPQPEPAAPVRKLEHNPATLEALIEWLEQQPAGTVYCWNDGGRCLFSNYGLAMGFGEGERDQYLDDVYWAREAYLRITREFSKTYPNTGAEPYSIGIKTPHTYGAALERAKSALQSAALSHRSRA